jgi:hypothetical protein
MSQLLFKAPKVLGRCQIRSLSAQIGKLTSHPTSIRPSRDEIKHERLSDQNLEVAIRSLYQDGLVVIENVIPHDCLDRLNKKMVEDAYYLQSKKENRPFNYNPGNIQQDAPPVREYFEPRIFMSKSANPDYTFRPQLLTLTRPHRNSNHLNSTRTPSEMDVLLRQYCNVSNCREPSKVSACPFRRRFRSPLSSFCTCDKCSPHNHDPGEWFY